MKQFVGEPIEPKVGSFDVSAISRGEPSLPTAFMWRGEEIVVGALRKTWRGTKTDRGDVYVKRHYFTFASADGRTFTVYCERQPAKAHGPRWWLYTVEG